LAPGDASKDFERGVTNLLPYSLPLVERKRRIRILNLFTLFAEENAIADPDVRQNRWCFEWLDACRRQVTAHIRGRAPAPEHRSGLSQVQEHLKLGERAAQTGLQRDTAEWVSQGATEMSLVRCCASLVAQAFDAAREQFEALKLRSGRELAFGFSGLLAAFVSSGYLIRFAVCFAQLFAQSLFLPASRTTAILCQALFSDSPAAESEARDCPASSSRTSMIAWLPLVLSMGSLVCLAASGALLAYVRHDGRRHQRLAQDLAWNTRGEASLALPANFWKNATLEAIALACRDHAFQEEVGWLLRRRGLPSGVVRLVVDCVGLDSLHEEQRIRVGRLK